jgi:hypothetical protein
MFDVHLRQGLTEVLRRDGHKVVVDNLLDIRKVAEASVSSRTAPVGLKRLALWQRCNSSVEL